MAGYKPSFRMTGAIVDRLITIVEQMGKITAMRTDRMMLSMREEYCVRNVHATLAMDGQSLDLQDVRRILHEEDGLAKKEVHNIYRMYQSITEPNPFSVEDLLSSHFVLTGGTGRKDKGIFRTGEVRVYEGSRVIHVAPPVRFLEKHLFDLLEWCRESELHPLVMSALFRFEFEAIHPFSDGNGRIGRFWHRILMGRWKELFYYLPIEEWIIQDQDRYFSALGRAYKEGADAFVEMFLGFVQRALAEAEDWKEEDIRGKTDQDNDQDKADQSFQNASSHANIIKLLEIVGDTEVSALDMMGRLGLKHRPTFRKNYLNPALRSGVLVRTVPDKPNSKNQRYRKRAH